MVRPIEPIDMIGDVPVYMAEGWQVAAAENVSLYLSDCERDSKTPDILDFAEMIANLSEGALKSDARFKTGDLVASALVSGWAYAQYEIVQKERREADEQDKARNR